MKLDNLFTCFDAVHSKSNWHFKDIISSITFNNIYMLYLCNTEMCTDHAGSWVFSNEWITQDLREFANSEWKMSSMLTKSTNALLHYTTRIINHTSLTSRLHTFIYNNKWSNNLLSFIIAGGGFFTMGKFNMTPALPPADAIPLLETQQQWFPYF